MLIGIDGNEANIKERVGVNVWAFEILWAVYKKVQEGTKKYNKIKIVVYLNKPPLEDLPKETENWRYRVIGPAKFWTRWRLPLDLYFHKPWPDIFLSLSHYSPKWSPVPRVVCIMDLSFLKYPEAFKPAVLWQLKNWTEESVRYAAHIVTISEFNKREIVREYKYPGEKITVIYPGVSDSFKSFQKSSRGHISGRGDLVLNSDCHGTKAPRNDKMNYETSPLKQKYGIHGRYLLFVGTRQPKKNLDRLIQAFGLLRKDFPDLQLMVAGKTWGQFSQEPGVGSKGGTPRNDGVGQGVKYLGFVPEMDLPALVAGAEALVLPSLYEGFGIPVIEAMSVGTLVAASNTTSLPEVVGDAGILFNPLDVKDMAEKIGLALSMGKGWKRKLTKKGMIRAERFSWDNVANQIIKRDQALLENN